MFWQINVESKRRRLSLGIRASQSVEQLHVYRSYSLRSTKSTELYIQELNCPFLSRRRLADYWMQSHPEHAVAPGRCIIQSLLW